MWVRKRYRKLYEDFKPETAAWRLVLIVRKLLIAWASIMFNAYPMFQVRVYVLVGCVCVWVVCVLLPARVCMYVCV